MRLWKVAQSDASEEPLSGVVKPRFFSPDRRRVVVLGSNAQVSDPTPRTALAMALAFSPDSQRLAATFMDSTVIHLWEVAAPGRTELGEHTGFIVRLMFSQDGRQIMSADSI